MIRARRTRRAQLITFALTLFVLISTAETPVTGQRRGAHERSAAVVPSRPGAGRPIQKRRASARPRLVLLIAVDQFRYDYLERFGDLFVANGINRLLREGASWAQANYDHTPTYTAPGHATMMTGTWPSENGIIANDWYDRGEGKKVSSVTDDAAKLLGGGGNESGPSPRRLTASTLGDEMRLATNDRAKVIGLSIKDRSAILPVGRHASAAYWFSVTYGRMVSSDYYFERLPGWVTRFNETRPADKFFGARWERLLPETEYLKRAGRDAPQWEDIVTTKDTNAFPHIITGGASKPGRDFYGELDYSPFANDLILDFAKQAVAGEELGADEVTDFLSVSFSANDYIGHRFGPYSHEAMDITLRVDRQIASLLDYIEARVGLGNTLVAFTADHGVAPIPEHTAALGLGGSRVQSADVVRAVRAAINARYGRRKEGESRNGSAAADYIQTFKAVESGKQVDREGFINGNLYLDKNALKRDGINIEEVERVAGEAALTVPGVRRYFTRTELERASVSLSDPIARRVLHGFYPRRSGDVVIIQEPYHILRDPPENPAYPRSTATHGSPYSYDTHVPLIIMGAGVKAGRYLSAAAPSDIAPTLAALLGVQSPSNATGRVLTEGLELRGARAANAGTVGAEGASLRRGQ